MNAKNRDKYSLYNVFLYFCVLLSGLVPRYIFTFKIHIVIGISMYTVAVVITWLIFVRHINIVARVECLLFIIWFILIVGSIWIVEGFGVWLEYIDWIITAILFMQIIYYNANENSFDIIARGIVDALFIQIVIGLYEVTFHRYLFEIGTISGQLYGNAAISMFRNANDYASFVVTILPFSVYLLVKKHNLFYRIYYSFIVVSSVFLTLRSESRGANLGLILIVGTIMFLYFRRSNKNKLIGILILVFAAFVIILSAYIRELISSSFDSILMDKSGMSNEYRINLIKNGLYFLKRTFGFGVGAGNLAQWLATESIYPISGLLLIHNWYLEIAVTFGVAFFVYYMYFHINIIVYLLKCFNMKDKFWIMGNTILISFISFSIVSISSSSNFYSEWVWMYLVFISSYVLFRKKAIKNAECEHKYSGEALM